MDEHFLFYIPPEDIREERMWFPEEEVRHIGKVLRKQAGDIVQATDGTGRLLDVELIVVDKKKAAGEIVQSREISAGPERVLAMGLIRQRDRLEFAVEKAVELGVTRLVLVHSDHSGTMTVKPARIEKTIISAMKQSRRCHLPVWEERDSFYDVLSAYRDNRTVIMADPEGVTSRDWHPGRNPALLMVGPEGGFSGKEKDQAIASAAQFVNLGSNRLRTETAACALLTLAGV